MRGLQLPGQARQGNWGGLSRADGVTGKGGADGGDGCGDTAATATVNVKMSTDVRGGFYTWMYERTNDRDGIKKRQSGRENERRSRASMERRMDIGLQGCYEHPSSKLCFGNGVL